MNTKEKYNYLIGLREIEVERIEKHDKYLSEHLDFAHKEVTRYQKLKNENRGKSNELRCKIRMLEEGMRIV